MIVLLYGPSGIGKSTTIKRGSEIRRDIRFEQFDTLVDKSAKSRGLRDLHELRAKFGTKGFLTAGIEAIGALENTLPLVVDVGAGAFDTPDFKPWLQRHTSILLIATPEAAFARVRTRPKEKRTLEEYAASEFSPFRRDLYDAATHRIDTSELAAQLVCDRLLEILDRNYLRAGGLQ